MDICSEKMIEQYLLLKNPLYAFRFPIALLLGIFIYGYFEMKKISSNSYIQQILIPIAAILFVMVLIDMISRMMVSHSEKERLMKLCKMFMAQPHMKGRTIDIYMIENYDGKVAGFETKGQSQTPQIPTVSEMASQNSEVIMDPFAPRQKSLIKLDPSMERRRKRYSTKEEGFENKGSVTMPYDSFSKHVENPLSLPAVDESGKCIEKSNCCNLCSGSGENPCKVVTAVPGPQWLPQTARSKQQEIVSGQMTPSTCPLY
jgi:hypothetical protein